MICANSHGLFLNEGALGLLQRIPSLFYHLLSALHGDAGATTSPLVAFSGFLYGALCFQDFWSFCCSPAGVGAALEW
jgi:hypothetical protein